MFDEKDVLAATALRMLAIDAVQAANSGHPVYPWGQLIWHWCCGPGI